MSLLKNIFSGGATKLVDSIGNVLDNVITTKEEKQQLTNEIAKAEMAYNLDVMKLNNEEKQIIIGDIGNARNREVQIQTSEQSTRLNKNIMPFMALGTILVVMALFFVLIFTPSVIKAETKDVIIYILGVLSAVLTQIYSYYFGSSVGSAEKQRTLNTMNKN